MDTAGTSEYCSRLITPEQQEKLFHSAKGLLPEQGSVETADAETMDFLSLISDRLDIDIDALNTPSIHRFASYDLGNVFVHISEEHGEGLEHELIITTERLRTVIDDDRNIPYTEMTRYTLDLDTKVASLIRLAVNPAEPTPETLNDKIEQSKRRESGIRFAQEHGMLDFTQAEYEELQLLLQQCNPANLTTDDLST